MSLFADVMFGPVIYIIEYLPLILLILVLLSVVMTGFIVGFLYFRYKKGGR